MDADAEQACWFALSNQERRRLEDEDLGRLIQRMERDVVRGNALRKILEAERLAAGQDAQHSNSIKGEL